MASRYVLTEEDAKLFLIEGEHKWVRGGNAYLAKRKNILYLNVLVEDVNSVLEYDTTKHSFILNYCYVNNNENKGEMYVSIGYSDYNNRKKIIISSGLEEFVIAYAKDIAKEYF